MRFTQMFVAVALSCSLLLAPAAMAADGATAGSTWSAFVDWITQVVLGIEDPNDDGGEMGGSVDPAGLQGEGKHRSQEEMGGSVDPAG